MANLPSAWYSPFIKCEWLLLHFITAARMCLLMTTRFGIEFAPEVVQADGNVRNLAWRICNAKKVLVSHELCPSMHCNHNTDCFIDRPLTACQPAVVEIHQRLVNVCLFPRVTCCKGVE